MTERSLDLAGGPDDVPRARHFVRETLSADGLAALGADAELVTSEIVTNALLHAAPPVRVVVSSGGDGARVTVYDGSRLTPVRGRPGEDAITGRGLLLVQHLASRWGLAPTDSGKAVWVELSSVGSAAEPDSGALHAAGHSDADHGANPAAPALQPPPATPARAGTGSSSVTSPPTC